MSSIWLASKETKILWITMLAMKDKYGVVRAVAPALARTAGLTLEECLTSLKELESPDVHSSSPEWEGRRVEKVPGGWLVLNHAKYQAEMSDMFTRARKAAWQALDRAKAKEAAQTPCKGANPPKRSNGKPKNTPSLAEQRNIEIEKDWGKNWAADLHPETGMKSPAPKFNPDNEAKCDL